MDDQRSEFGLNLIQWVVKVFGLENATTLCRRWIREVAKVNWDAVTWTNGASVALTQHGPVWVTCTKEERFPDRNLVPAIRTESLLMVWGAIY